MGKETGGQVQALAWEGFGKNFEAADDDKHVYVRWEKGKEFGLSKSEKTVIIASTEGNKRFETKEGEVVVGGFNVYRKATDEDKKEKEKRKKG